MINVIPKSGTLYVIQDLYSVKYIVLIGCS